MSETKIVEKKYYNYPNSDKCMYCGGDVAVSKVSFLVEFNDGSKEVACVICLNEYSLEHPELVKIIKRV